MINTKRHRKTIDSIVTQCSERGLDDIGQMCLRNALVKILKRLELAKVRATKTVEPAAQTDNSIKAEIASIFNDASVNTREGICIMSYQQFARLRQLSAI